jgi:HEAT repeat protein
MPPIAIALVASLLTADADFGWPDSITFAAQDAAELPDPQRLRTLERLTARAGERALPVLVPLLADRDPSVRLFAARRLGRAGAPPAIEAATRWIASPNLPLVDRQFGLDVLREAPSLPDTARQAVERALRDPDASVRITALDTLERHDALPSLPAVLSALDDDSREVRLRAVRLVAGKRDARIALPLLARVDDADRQVRSEAIRALGAHPRATPALLRLMAEATDEARAAAMDALAALRAEAAIPAFVALARRRPADDVARRAQLALGKIATPAAVAALIALTRTPPVSADTRAALRAAGAAAVPGLERELASGTPGSAAIAAATLGEIGDRRATAPLCAALERRAELAPVALDALARIGDAAAIPTLVRASESGDLETRRRGYAALLALRDPRASVALARGLADGDPYVRELSARLAAATGAPASALAVASLLLDGEQDVRRAAAASLAALATPSSALVTSIVGAITKPGGPKRDGDEWQAIGEALERAAEPGDAGRLAAAWKSARGAERPALVRALAAAQAGRPFTDSALLLQLVDALEGEGPLPLAAADALGTSAMPADARDAFARRFADATPAVRARACDAIARLPEGGRWLAALMRARDEPTEVRAAAAWAAHGLDDGDARDALAAAARDDVAPVADNARAALALSSADRRSKVDVWRGARLRARDGTPVSGQWVAISVEHAGDVWAMTDDAGVVRLLAPAGTVQLRVPGSLLRAE